MSEPPPLADAPPTLADLWELLRLPILLALAGVAVTWLVWYFTSASCSLELAQVTGCNPSRVARYINLTALNNMATHAIIAGGGGGLWSYRMITKERKAREYLAKQLAEERERNAEERAQAAERQVEERRQADERMAEERRQADERMAEERRQVAERQAEERRQFAEVLQSIVQQLGEERAQAVQERAQAAQERAQAAEERRQSMLLIEELRRQIADRQNGANGSASP